MNGAFTSLLVVEVALTSITLAMWAWRGFLDMKEDDHLVLDNAESHLQREQAAIRARVNSLTLYLKVAGLAWGLLAIVIAGGYVVKELKLI